MRYFLSNALDFYFSSEGFEGTLYSLEMLEEEDYILELLLLVICGSILNDFLSSCICVEG